MKNQIIFIFVLMALNTKYIMAQGVLFDKQYLHAVQSQDFIGQDASYVFDGIYNSNQTNITNSNALWLQINTKCIRKINTIKIYPVISTNYYVFISKSPFFHINIEALIRDPWVTYFNITGGDGGGPGSSTNIPVGNVLGQYILILSTNTYERISISEVDIYGDYVDCGPYYPPQYPPIIGPQVDPPYGICGPWNWPPNSPPVLPPDIIGPPFIGPDIIDVLSWWSSQEICDDGIDNDKNGLVDCEDYPCGVGTFNVVQTNPTCPICQNGRICVFANNNVNQVSIDNGASWTAFPNTGFYCFENLNTGMYQVRLRTLYGCEDEKDITLTSPPGESELCQNGGFEAGNFSNWSGGVADNYSITFNNTTIDVNNRHTIVQNNFVDPFAPFISGMQGTFSARLGNTSVGSESERLTYCFTVNNTNSNLSFNYAAVLELPGHNTQLPFFEYKIFRRSDGSIIGQNRVDTDHPFLVNSNRVGALGWDCIATDLSGFIGQEVCVEFISSDCGCGAHFGYGYIDGICTMGGNNINVTLSSKRIFCENQPIEVKVDGVGFSQYKWIISKIDASGKEFDTFEGPMQSGFQASLADVKKYYEDNSNFTLTCPQKFKVKFEGQSGCGSGNTEIVLDYICPEYNIDYCNPYFYCISNNINQLAITGVNDCDNCTYEWSSPETLNGMINRNDKFPILDKSVALNAFDKLYEVQVTTPEGCIYEESFKAQKGGLDIVVEKIDYGYCAYKAFAKLIFETPVNTNDLAITITNTIGNATIPFTLTGEGTTWNLEFSVLRNSPSIVRINVDYSLLNCTIGNCSKFVDLPLINGPIHSQWKAVYPDNFSPNGDGLNDFFELTIRSVNENKLDCKDINWTNSSVYSYRLEIYDRLGNLMLDDTVINGPYSIQGILGNEIKWDGKFNGLPVNPGVYTWKATIQSCYDGSNQCNDCGDPPLRWATCGTSGNQIITGTITVVL